MINISLLTVRFFGNHPKHNVSLGIISDPRYYTCDDELIASSFEIHLKPVLLPS
jgi:hypothetical protein